MRVAFFSIFHRLLRFCILAGLLLPCRAEARPNADSLCVRLKTDFGKMSRKNRLQYLAEIDYRVMITDHESYLCFVSSLLKNANSDNEPDIVKHLQRIQGDALCTAEDYAGAILCYQYAMETEKHEHGMQTEFYAGCLGDVAYCYLMLGMYDKVVQFSLRGATTARAIGDEALLSDQISNMGSAWFSMGKLDSALLCYEQVLRIDQQRGDRAKEGVTLNNIGRIYFRYQRYDQAAGFYRQALAISLEINDIPQQANRFSNLGHAYLALNRVDSAEACFMRSFAINRQIGNFRKKAIDISNMALVAHANGNAGEAINKLEAAIAIAREQHYSDLEADFWNRIGDIYLEQKKYRAATAAFDTGLTCANRIGARYQMLEIAQSLYKTHKQIGNAELALKYLETYSGLLDSVRSAENEKLQIEFSVRHDTQRKEQKISLLQKENQIHEMLLRRNAIVLVFSLLLLITVLFASVLLYRRYRDKQQLNRLLKLKNEELRTLYDDKKRFLSILAHDLRSPLWSFNALTAAMLEHYSTYSDTNRLEALHELNTSSRELHELLNNILLWEINSQSAFRCEPEALCLNQLLNESLALFRLSAIEKRVNIMNGLTDEYTILADSNAVQAILRNLLSNALKYSPVGSQIDISATCNETLVKLSIADSGTGLDAESLSGLFAPDTPFVPGPHSAGLGLKLCAGLSSANGGRIWAENRVPSGAVFHVTFRKADRK